MLEERHYGPHIEGPHNVEEEGMWVNQRDRNELDI